MTQPETLTNRTIELMARITSGDFARFTLVDRMIVFCFLTVQVVMMVLFFNEHLSEADLAELSKPLLLGRNMFDILGHILLLFLLLPILRAIGDALLTYAKQQYRQHWGEPA